MTGACTIVSPNYLPFARTLAASYRLHHPDQPFFVLVVADIANKSFFENEPFTAVLLQELPLGNLRSLAMKYDILELNTNIKPSFLKFLLATFGLNILIYLDPDISVYQMLTPVFDLLQSACIALTPHLTVPLPPDGKLPSEQDMLYNGTYNLGFIALRSSEETSRMLDWWELRCLNLGFNEARTGLFVDQKWMNLAPAYFPGIKLLRHPGCNTAYWNLQDRHFSSTGDTLFVNSHSPLIFYHFSGIDVDDPESLSSHTNRFALVDRPDLYDLFADYKERVRKNRVPALDSLRYGFDRFSDETVINRMNRRMYSKHAHLYIDADPFDARGQFFAFCRRHRLLSGRRPAGRSTWHEFDSRDNRVRSVHYLLRIALRMLGPDLYELLMRYLSYITVIRNQSIFIKD